MKLARNDFAERAVLAIVFQCSDPDKLWELDESDFGDPTHKFLLSELNAMVANGVPLGDAVACSTWFCSQTAKARAQEAIGEDHLPTLVAEIFSDGALAANWNYYLDLLRGERLKRALQLLIIKSREKLETEDGDTVLLWLTEQLHKISDSYEDLKKLVD